MRVDVQLNDDELALLSGYNRSTSMGIKKPGELQRELLSDMENIEEKREVKSAPEEQSKTTDTVESKEVASASEDKSEETKSAPVKVRSDFLSMLSAMAQPNTHEDKDSEDSEAEEAGILPEDAEDEEDGSVLPEDEDEEDVSVLPDDDEDEDAGILPEDDEDGSVLPDDEDEDVSTLPADDDEYAEDDGILLADDEDAEGESVASEEPTTGITEQQEDEGDEYSSELPEDDDDEEYSSELPADEEDSSELPEDEEDSSELPSDEDDEEDSSVLPDDDADDYGVLPFDEDDEEDTSVLPADEDEESSVLPEDNEEVEDESTPAGIQDTPQEDTAQPTTKVVEHLVSPSPKAHKSVHPVTHQPAALPVGYSAPSVPLYDFILNNGGSMLIEDVKKYYPIDEVKKALNLGKIYRFGNKVGV